MWHQRGQAPRSRRGALPPPADPTGAALDLARYADVKTRFFARDETARYLSAEIAAPEPDRAPRPARGSSRGSTASSSSSRPSASCSRSRSSPASTAPRAASSPRARTTAARRSRRSRSPSACGTSRPSCYRRRCRASAAPSRPVRRSGPAGWWPWTGARPRRPRARRAPAPLPRPRPARPAAPAARRRRPRPRRRARDRAGRGTARRRACRGGRQGRRRTAVDAFDGAPDTLARPGLLQALACNCWLRGVDLFLDLDAAAAVLTAQPPPLPGRPFLCGSTWPSKPARASVGCRRPCGSRSSTCRN